MAFLGVDIGGTNTLIGVGDGEFDLVESVSTRTFLDDMDACLKRTLAAADRDDVETVCVASAGPIDRERGVFYPPNLDRAEVDLEGPLGAFGELRIINDCAAAVLGEYHYGGHDAENLLYVTVSSGIGAGMIVDGNLIEGWNGNFGEVGHMPVCEGDMECGCGGYDHWEAYCSGNSLPRLAEATTGVRFRDAKAIFEAAASGNARAERTLERMTDINVQAFATLVNLYNPEKVLVGGAVALNHPEVVVDPLPSGIGEHIANRPPRIEVCSLRERAVLHGLRAVCNGNGGNVGERHGRPGPDRTPEAGD